MWFSGNEKPDVLVKRYSQLTLAYHNALLLHDYVPSLHRSIRASCQSLWNQCIADVNKLAQLEPSLGPWSSCSQQYRRLKVFLSRLRIGHTRLTHGQLMARESRPICGRCQVYLSVFHVLVERSGYSVPRNRVLPSLTSVPPRQLLSFLFLTLRCE